MASCAVAVSPLRAASTSSRPFLAPPPPPLAASAVPPLRVSLSATPATAGARGACAAALLFPAIASTASSASPPSSLRMRVACGGVVCPQAFAGGFSVFLSRAAFPTTSLAASPGDTPQLLAYPHLLCSSATAEASSFPTSWKLCDALTASRQHYDAAGGAFSSSSAASCLSAPSLAPPAVIPAPPPVASTASAPQPAAADSAAAGCGAVRQRPRATASPSLPPPYPFGSFWFPFGSPWSPFCSSSSPFVFSSPAFACPGLFLFFAVNSPSLLRTLFSAAPLPPALRHFYSQRSAGLKIPRYERVHTMTAKELRHAVADAARRQLRMRNLWDSFLYRACVLRSELTPEQVASLLYSLAAVEKPLLSFVDFILEDVRRRTLHCFRLQDASLLLAALSRIKGARDPLLLHALLPVLLKRLRLQPPPAVSDPHNRNSSCSSSSSVARNSVGDSARDTVRSTKCFSGTADGRVDNNRGKNRLSTLKYIALLAHAYVRLKGPQAELLLGSIAARLAAPECPLLPPLRQHAGVLGNRVHDRREKQQQGSSSKEKAQTQKKKNRKIHMPHSLVLLLGAYAAHARRVCERGTPAVNGPGTGLSEESAEAEKDKEKEEKKEAFSQHQVPFAAVIETLLEHGLLQLSAFSPRDCTYFLKALADLCACDTRRRRCGQRGKDRGSSSSNSFGVGGCMHDGEGFLVIGGTSGLRGILSSVYQQLLALRFDLKGSDCVDLLASIWSLEGVLAAAALPDSGSAVDGRYAASYGTYKERMSFCGARFSNSRGGGMSLSRLLLEELLFRAADLPSAVVLDAIRVLLEKKQQSLHSDAGSQAEVYPALEAALLSRLGEVIPSLFPIAEARRRSLSVTPAALVDLLRQLCVPRVQPYLPPSFALPSAVCRAVGVAVPAARAEEEAAAAAAAGRLGFFSAAAAEAAMAKMSNEEAGAATRSLFTSVEPLYCFSKVAGLCMQRLLAALAASSGVKRFMNLQTAASLCWTCAALRLRDPLLGRLLLQHRNALHLSIATARAAAGEIIAAAADGREAAAARDAEAQGEDSPAAEYGAATERKVVTSGYAACEGGRAAAAKHEAATTAAEAAAVPKEPFTVKAEISEHAESAEGKESGFPDYFGREALTSARAADAAAAVEALRKGDEILVSGKAAAAAGLSTLAAGLAHLGMADAADALAVFPLLGTVERFKDVTTALTALVAAAIFDLTRSPATLAPSLLYPAAAYIYEQRAALLPEHYVALRFVAGCSISASFPPCIRSFFAHAAHFCSSIYPLHCSRVKYAGSCSASAVSEKRKASTEKNEWSPCVSGERSRNSCVTGVAAARKGLPFCAATRTDKKMTSTGGAAAAGASRCDLFQTVRAVFSSSGPSIPSHLFLMVMRGAPHRCRASVVDLLRAAGAKGALRTPGSSNRDIPDIAKDAQIRSELLQMRLEDMAERMLSSPFHVAATSQQNPAAIQFSSLTGETTAAGRAEEFWRPRYAKDSVIDVLRVDRVRKGLDLHEDEEEAHGDSAVAAAVDKWKNDSFGRSRKKSHRYNAAVVSFPERVRRHFEIAWKGVHLCTEVFVPACALCIPLAVDLQSVSQHIASLEETAYVGGGAVTAAGAGNFDGEIAGVAAAGAEVVVACATDTTPRTVATFPPLQEKPATSRVSECNSKAVHSAQPRAAARIDDEAANSSTESRPQGRNFSGGVKADRRGSGKRGSENPAETGRIADWTVLPGTSENQTFQNSTGQGHLAMGAIIANPGAPSWEKYKKNVPLQERGSRNHQQKHGNERNIYFKIDGTTRSERRWKRRVNIRTALKRGRCERTHSQGLKGGNGSGTSGRKKTEDITAVCCDSNPGSPTRSRSDSTNHEGGLCLLGGVRQGKDCARCEHKTGEILSVSAEGLKNDRGAAWTMTGRVTVRKETHALVDLLWEDFDFLRPAPKRKANTATGSTDGAVGRGQQEMSSFLCPGKVAELNVLKQQGWAVLCLSEITWRCIEKSSTKERKNGRPLQAELKKYVMQCIAGLKPRAFHQPAEEKQEQQRSTSTSKKKRDRKWHTAQRNATSRS